MTTNVILKTSENLFGYDLTGGRGRGGNVCL